MERVLVGREKPVTSFGEGVEEPTASSGFNGGATAGEGGKDLYER